MENPKIGFIGLGTMGRGMADNLKKTYPLCVYNRTRSRAEALAAAEIAGSPREAAERSEIIFTCVSDDRALEEILSGSGGLFEADLTGKILVDSGTTSLGLTEKIAREAKRKDFEFLDAPVTGSKSGAEEGKLMFMVGGKKEVFDRIVPVLKTMGERFVYCGRTPNGQSAKHALNLTLSLVLESYLEGLAFGLKAGVPLKAMEEIFGNSGAKNGIASFKMPYIKKRDFAPHFMLRLMDKDLKLAALDRARFGVYAPLADEIIKIFDQALSRGNEDVSTIAKTLEKANGVSFSE